MDLDSVMLKKGLVKQCNIWGKVFKSGLSQFCGRQPLKNLLSPLLNTFSHMIVKVIS